MKGPMSLICETVDPKLAFDDGQRVIHPASL
jgi:hypothetical protein